MGNSEKSLRQHLELDIVENKCICKQGELIVELKLQGVKVTQSTLSRDLQELNITRKRLSNQEVKYVVNKEKDFTRRFKNIFKFSVVNIYFQEYFISIDTVDGMASLIGAFIDKLENIRIAGTIAKKNHVLVLCRSIDGTRQMFKELKYFL